MGESRGLAEWAERPIACRLSPQRVADPAPHGAIRAVDAHPAGPCPVSKPIGVAAGCPAVTRFPFGSTARRFAMRFTCALRPASPARRAQPKRSPIPAAASGS